MRFFNRLLSGRNPQNLTQLHHRSAIRRHGYTIGDHSYGCPKLRFPGPGTALSIGRYCSFADGIEIFLSGNHRTDWVTTYPFFDFPDRWPAARNPGGHPASRGPVSIGHDVWIGSRAIILSGSTIGNGACVGAGSVVAGEIPPYAVAAGNPARVIRMRFPAHTVALLQRLAWWDLPDDVVARLVPDLLSRDINRLILALEEIRKTTPEA